MDRYLNELLSSCSSSSNKWMIQVAKEELEMLEAQYPNRFGLLKNEIESFIISAESDKQQQQQLQNLQPCVSCPNSFSSSSVSVSTQASTNRNMRKTSADAAIERADAVIERAEACLRKIRELKQSLSRS